MFIRSLFLAAVVYYLSRNIAKIKTLLYRAGAVEQEIA
jgi:hypothetical protein